MHLINFAKEAGREITDSEAECSTSKYWRVRILSYLLTCGVAGFLPAADLPGPAPVTFPGTHHLVSLQGPHGGCLAEPGAARFALWPSAGHRPIPNQTFYEHRVAGNRDQMRGSSLEMMGQTRESAIQTANSPSLVLPSPSSELTTIHHFHFFLRKVPLSPVPTLKNLSTVKLIHWLIDWPQGRKISVHFWKQEEDGTEGN